MHTHGMFIHGSGTRHPGESRWPLGNDSEGSKGFLPQVNTGLRARVCVCVCVWAHSRFVHGLTRFLGLDRTLHLSGKQKVWTFVAGSECVCGVGGLGLDLNPSSSKSGEPPNLHTSKPPIQLQTANNEAS